MSELQALVSWTPYLLGGFGWNILIAAVAMLVGTSIGAALAWTRLCGRPWLRRASSGITELSRSVPTIVLQFYLAFMLPAEMVPAWLKAALALAVAVVGFTSDNLLIALREWRRGRRAAALLFVPSWGSYLLIIVIASSTASLIGVGELVSRSNSVISASEGTELMVPVYLYAGLIFFGFCWPLMAALRLGRSMLAGRYSPCLALQRRCCATMAVMRSQVVYLPGTTALVLDSPHSGTEYPEDFRFSCDAELLRRAQDTHVEALYDFAPAMGVAWIEALFPRSYLDPNRHPQEIDVEMFDEDWPDELATDPAVLAKVRLGKGLVWRCTDEGVPIYDRRLRVAEVRARIEQCWKPYHAAVAAAIDAAHARHGYSIHINCHSMPALAASHATDFPGLVHDDFVVGDRDGTTASPQLSNWLCEQLRAKGYSVSYNHPYKGVELVRRYGDPAHHRHSLQLEINRRLYMDEATLQRHAGFERLRRHLRELVTNLLALDPRGLA